MIEFRTLSRAQQKREWEAGRDALAERMGITADDAVELLETLPYSTIPNWYDANEVIDWFAEHPVPAHPDLRSGKDEI